MHEVLVKRLGGLSLPRKSVVRLTDRPDMTLDVYRGRKTTIQQFVKFHSILSSHLSGNQVGKLLVITQCISLKATKPYQKLLSIQYIIQNIRI